MVGIYKITNPKGKVYIGQSTNINKRKNSYKKLQCVGQTLIYNSLKKYGWENHHFEVIEVCGVEQLNERENYWGKYYDTLEEGLNLRLGDGRGSCSDIIKEKISKSNSKPKPKGFGDKMSKVHLGKGRSKESKSKQSKALKGRTSPNKGKKWSEESKKKFGKTILQYDINGNFIREWDTITQASKELNIKGINENLKNRSKTAGGFIWKEYYKGFPKKLSRSTIEYHTSTKYRNNHAPLKPFYVYNQEGELLHEFPSLVEASKIMGKHPSNISAALKGKKKNYLNLIWKYKEL